MPDDTELLLRPGPAESPAARRKAPRRQPEMAPRAPSALAERPRPSRRPWLRWALFLLLPLVLLAGGFWYVTGGQVMSTDDAYVEADKVGVSTDVSGIVKEVDVAENQHVEAGRGLYRLDELPCRLALQRAAAQIGGGGRAQRAQGELPRHAGADPAGAAIRRVLRSRIPPPAEPLSTRCRGAGSLDMAARRNLLNAQQKLALSISNSPRSPPTSRRSRWPDREASAVSRCRGATRRGAAPVRSLHRRQGAIHRHCDQCARSTLRQISRSLDDRFLFVVGSLVWVDANPKETELTYVRPGSP